MVLFGGNMTRSRNRMRTVSVKMESETVDRMDRICRRKGMTRSEFIREAIEYLVGELESTEGAET